MANNSEKGSTLPRSKHALGSGTYRTERTAAELLLRLFKGFWCS